MSLHSINSFSRKYLLNKRLMQQLGERANIFQGVTNPNERKQRARKLILENALSNVRAGKRQNGKWATFAEYYELAFGEPLIPNNDNNGDAA
jgi:hypothetical protein